MALVDYLISGLQERFFNRSEPDETRSARQAELIDWFHKAETTYRRCLVVYPTDQQLQTLLKEACNYVVFIPWSTGTMSVFEHDLYAKELSPGEWNARWWELAAKYQGIDPPAPRGEEFCDAATKTHINDDPAQYYAPDQTFKPGDVMSIEPGIYVDPEWMKKLPDTPKNRAMLAKIGPAIEKYRWIGVRIEDNYALTERGLEWLSSGVPREIAQIEALMARPDVELPGGGVCRARI